MNELKEASKQPIIYCDLDGVLVDMMKGVRELTGVSDWDEAVAIHGRVDLWNMIKAEGSKWWADLEWKSDGKQLWKRIKDLDPIILTAGAVMRLGDVAKIGKQEWCAKNLGSQVDVIVSYSAKEKQELAGPGKILIDDTERNIRQWRAKGGIGILHHNSDQTIAELNEHLSRTNTPSVAEGLKSLAAAGLMAAGIMGTDLSAAAATKHPSISHASPKKARIKAEVPLADLEVMAATLIGEAGGEGAKGMHAVANVIMNRTKGDPSRVRAVCLKPWQFSMWNDHLSEVNRVVARSKKHPRWKSALLLAQQATKGQLHDITGGATFYFNPSVVRPSWAEDFRKTTTIGNHDFYSHGKNYVSRFY